MFVCGMMRDDVNIPGTYATLSSNTSGQISAGDLLFREYGWMRSRIFNPRLEPRHLEKQTTPSGKILIWDSTVGEWFNWENKGTGDSAESLDSECPIEGSLTQQ